ncbi:unnamed protein product [Agarophyton chilense]|eukprot:gb/GEZJ01000714.1/.p1 GENE.gb/GEZJ01000714.1/~~gb/GEZJ01000714.1/.p1  ORF type:complete len:437 (-),score=75.38 gb/GEZJ01000714.1/:1013-2323(-)
MQNQEKKNYDAITSSKEKERNNGGVAEMNSMHEDGNHQSKNFDSSTLNECEVKLSQTPQGSAMEEGDSNFPSESAKEQPLSVKTDTQASSSKMEMVDESYEEWIDRTNEPLHFIGNGYELTQTLTNLYLTNNRIPVIEHLEKCINLRELVLRQNAIQKVEGLENLVSLSELDLYMNQITEIPPTTFATNKKLQKLDLSFNQLRDISNLPCANLANLEELYLISNKIKVIRGLCGMPKLSMLELGDNRIRIIENLDKLKSLEGLWLGRNKITKIENLSSLKNLKRLSLQSNRIEAVENLEHLTLLEEVYLSHNGLKSMKGIKNLKNLRVLDLGSNFIENIEEVECLKRLKEFWVNGNKLGSLEELALLEGCEELETVYLEFNPLASDPQYRRKALNILPSSLEQLDALLVSDVYKELAEQESLQESKSRSSESSGNT